MAAFWEKKKAGVYHSHDGMYKCVKSHKDNCKKPWVLFKISTEKNKKDIYIGRFELFRMATYYLKNELSKKENSFLKVCPLCASQATLYESKYEVHHKISCNKCGLTLKDTDKTRLIKHWNMRENGI